MAAEEQQAANETEDLDKPSKHYSPEFNVTVRQQNFIVELVSGKTVKAAATAVGVSEKTAHAWLHLFPVKVALKAAQGLMFETSLHRLNCLMDSAIEAVEDIMSKSYTPPAVKIRAAQFIFDQANKMRSINDESGKEDNELDKMLRNMKI